MCQDPSKAKRNNERKPMVQNEIKYHSENDIYHDLENTFCMIHRQYTLKEPMNEQ